MNPESLSPTQAVASIIAGSVILAILGGSLVSWSVWLSGKRLPRIAKRPLATIGLIDLMMTVLLLIGFVSLAFVGLYAAKTISKGSSTAQTSLDVPSEPVDAQSQSARDAPSKEDIETSNDAVSDPSQTIEEAAPTKKESKKKVPSEEQFVFSALAMSSQLLCVIAVTFFVRMRTGTSSRFLGWRTDQIAGDVLAGVQCFLMATPFLLGLNAFFIYWSGIPYEHPIQQMLEKFPWMLGIAFWQASIVAPISEEFAFRSLLIGWFESIHFGKNKFESFVAGFSSHSETNLVADSNAHEHDDANTTSAIQELESSYTPPWWPALISGTLFGLAHFSFGVSWISLVVFGVILGRLYQNRQSLIPVIVVHFMFNTMGILFMGLKIWMPNPS